MAKVQYASRNTYAAGLKRAAELLFDESDRLRDIRDAYIEAKTTGKMYGRRIKPELADKFAQDFRVRSDAVLMAAEMIERELKGE